MDSDAFLDQEYENLNDAILQAIVTSKKVQNILSRFKEQNHINDKAVLNLFLGLDELYQMMDENPSKPDTYKLEPGASTSALEKPMDNEKRSSSKEENIIDGESLSLNEVLFEKFYQGKFNETAWMKKARVRF
ncbi:MAG: hypothetical protein COW89_08970 [Nitrospinae bacterium CG22_combo_CG10-13_8_21_14_all_47_10]|nr:MAG: hypothetical protein COW89_08970 [Nitrospinae bacterium CG22_combo_CG10-13_8_21_14_all_47_10]